MGKRHCKGSEKFVYLRCSVNYVVNNFSFEWLGCEIQIFFLSLQCQKNNFISFQGDVSQLTSLDFYFSSFFCPQRPILGPILRFLSLGCITNHSYRETPLNQKFGKIKVVRDFRTTKKDYLMAGNETIKIYGKNFGN